MSLDANLDAIATLVTENMAGYSANNTKVGDADAAFKYANMNGGNVCVVNFAGASDDEQRDAFDKNNNLYWNVIVSFALAFDATTVDSDIISLADSFLTMYSSNKRLSTGSVWKWRGTSLPEGHKRGDRTWVDIHFTLAVKETI